MTQLIQVAIKEGGRPYTYSAPDDITVGDVVHCPTKTGGFKGTVVALGSSYPGPVLSILGKVDQ